MTKITYEIALYPMACYPDGSSALFNPSDTDAPKVKAPEWFDVCLNVYTDDLINDPEIEFEELDWEEATQAMALLSKQYSEADLNDLTEQCRSHWSPPSTLADRAQEYRGVIAVLLEQISQMSRMISDDDGTIAAAVDAGETALGVEL